MGTLIAIDFVVLILFSLGGIAFHEVEGSVVAELLRIACPFLIGYFPVGYALGAYDTPTTGRRFFLSSTATLILGLGCGFLLRGIQRGALPSPVFMGIAYVFCAVLSVVGRGLYWSRWSRRAP